MQLHESLAKEELKLVLSAFVSNHAAYFAICLGKVKSFILVHVYMVHNQVDTITALYKY